MTEPNTVAPEAATPPPAKPPARVDVVWAGGQHMEVSRAGSPILHVDGEAKAGPSPVDTLIGALAACAAIDVVEILAKRRTPVASLQVQATGERAHATPARVTRAVLAFTISGAGIERVHAERAIDLSVNKYCSVRDSLDPEMPVEWTLELR